MPPATGRAPAPTHQRAAPRTRPSPAVDLPGIPRAGPSPAQVLPAPPRHSQQPHQPPASRSLLL